MNAEIYHAFPQVEIVDYHAIDVWWLPHFEDIVRIHRSQLPDDLDASNPDTQENLFGIFTNPKTPSQLAFARGELIAYGYASLSYAMPEFMYVIDAAHVNPETPLRMVRHMETRLEQMGHREMVITAPRRDVKGILAHYGERARREQSFSPNQQRFVIRFGGGRVPVQR